MNEAIPQPESPIVTAIRSATSREHISRILTEGESLRPSGKTRRYWLRAKRERLSELGLPHKVGPLIHKLDEYRGPNQRNELHETKNKKNK